MAADRPNLVFVTVDSLRADRCGFMGYDGDTTPTLDRLAEEGLVFSNAYAPGARTPDSLPGMFTGEYPDSVLGHAEGVSDIQQHIARHVERFDTIQDRLSRLGYETAGFTPNPWTSEYFGFDQGFDYYEDFMNEDRSEALWERMIAGRGSQTIVAVRLLMSWLQRANTFKAWEHFYDDVLEWIEGASEPYFVWIFLLDVHFPYLPDGQARTQSRWRTYEANLRLYVESQQTPYSDRVHDQLETAYDDAIRYTDRFFGRLTDDVDDATIVTTADHGEGFGEHGTYGHHDQLYEENVHVPLVVWGDGSQGRVDEPFSLRRLPELMTTVATDGDPASVTRPVVGSITNSGRDVAVSGQDWRFIRSDDGETEVRVPPGYDADVGDSEVVERCGDVLDGWMEHHRERKRIEDAVAQIEQFER